MPTTSSAPVHHELVTAWQAALTAHTPGTIARYGIEISRYSDWLADLEPPLALDAVTGETLQGYRDHLLRLGRRGTELDESWAVLLLFNRWLVETDRLELAADIDRVDTAIADDASFADLTGLAETCTTSGFEDTRDRALLLVMRDTALDVDHLHALKLDDVSRDTTAVRIPLSHDRTQRCPLSGLAAVAVAAYLEARACQPAATNTPKLWIGERMAMPRSAIERILLRRRFEARWRHLNAGTLTPAR